ncbi:MAG: hypothetical protein K2W82_08905 [Candidatus Obscuribacterales bacterium]|nr:hypothetical protein [Candidatus Obscuribacterales bacterium]
MLTNMDKSFFATSLLIAIFVAHPAYAFDDNWSLFPEDNGKPNPLASGDAYLKGDDKPAKQSKSDSAAKPATSEGDSEMRQQMSKVSSWLQEFSLRNHGNFPGIASDTNSPQAASQVQLTELVGPNPYADVASASPSNEELNGLGPGISAYYGSEGSPASGSPVESDEWMAEQQAQKVGRVQLGMDYSISSSSIEAWRNEPPDSWRGAPGTIYANGNYQGLFYVWGAGIDGKPVKDSSGRRTYIVTGRTGATQQDQIAPNEGN